MPGASDPRALIGSPRAYLRPLERTDAPELERLFKESRRLHRPWITAPRDVLGDYEERSKEGRVLALLVCPVESGTIAGVINLNDIIRGVFQNAFVGYYAHAAYAGRGLMTEGLSMAARYAFTVLRLHRLEANIQPGNERSRALAQRCGFRYEGMSPRYLKIGGRWRDHERWAMTIEDWREQRGRARASGAR